MTFANSIDRPTAAPPARLPVRVTGMPTADDAIAALASAGKWPPNRWTLLFIPLVLLAIGGLLAGGRPRGGRRLAVLLLFLGLAAFVVARLRSRRRFLNSWKARPDNLKPVVWTFCEDGLYTETSTTQALRSWGAFAYAKITDELLVLAYPGNAMFSFVPRRFFASESEWLAACNLLRSKLTIQS